MPQFKPHFANMGNTVGIISIEDRGEGDLIRLNGFFNKELLKELTELFDLFERRDMAVYFYQKEGSSLLLLCPDENKNVFLSVAGRSEVGE